MIRIKKGLDLPILGEPRQAIETAAPPKTVALVANDYIGMKPTMEVEEGSTVKIGEVLFTDKKTPGVKYTSPASGTVIAVNRGAKRVFQSVVIELDGKHEEVEFPNYRDSDLSTLPREKVASLLVDSGLWPSFRTRPYSKVPALETVPNSIFVTAMDTNPLAPNPGPIIQENRDFFTWGLQTISRLTDGKVFVCKRSGIQLPGEGIGSVETHEFEGPHPAGLAGTHIHHLDPVHLKKTVWWINYQDVIAIGKLFVSGRLPVERVISLAGPVVKEPRLLRVPLGICIDDLIENELNDEVAGKPDQYRAISGSVLAGRASTRPLNYLGRYHLQVSVIAENREREFFGWQKPGVNVFSVTRLFASAFMGSKKFAMTTTTGGSKRAMVPIGSYEKVMPLDMLPTQLLRSLIVEDTEQAQLLGCLELDEEDLALCTFVCPGKYEYGPILRKNLSVIEKEG